MHLLLTFYKAERKVPNLSPVCNQTFHVCQEEDALMAHHLQLHASFWNNVHNSAVPNVGQAVYFWRDNNGWAGPGVAVKVHKHALNIAHTGLTKTADRYRLCAAPMSRSIVDDELTPPLEDETEHSSTAEQQ